VGELTKTIGTLNPAIQALTGVSLAACLGSKLGGGGGGGGGERGGSSEPKGRGK